MSNDYKVPYTRILDIQPHYNAERLEVATVYGFQVITQKGKYKVGDPVVYVPIDSILPEELELFLFPAESKIRLHHHRVRQIRIRGLASQGMIVDPVTCNSFGLSAEHLILEQDLAQLLGITKYEPPIKGSSMTPGSGKGRNKKHDHPLFHQYNGLNNIKWFPGLFAQDELVVYQEKMHGTNARASVLPFQANTLWKKLLRILRLAPKYEYHYGSNKVQITGNSQYKGWKGWEGEDVYGKVFRDLDIFSRIQPGEIVYGEIVGPGIQANYHYGLEGHKFLLFDVKQIQDDGTMRWLNPGEVALYAKARGLELVPYIEMSGYSKERAYALTQGPSVYHPETKVREGIVIKAIHGYNDERGNKKALKWVNEEYLDDTKNTDNH